MQPQVELKNPWRNGTCSGTVWLKVAHDDSEECTLHYDLTDADPRCINAAALPAYSCRFAAYNGSDCADRGHPLRSSRHVYVDDLWSGARYNASSDGAAKGKTGRLHLGLEQDELMNRILIAFDADGEAIACGHVDVRCMRILGMCFYVWARWLTGAAAIFAILDSAWLIHKHMKYNLSTALRRYTVRILLMVPIYSTQAFVALWFKVNPRYGELLRFFRELYEAIVLFSFLQFILTSVGGPASVVQRFDGHRAAARIERKVRRATGSATDVGDSSSDESAHVVDRGNTDSDNESVVSGPSTEESRAQLNHMWPWNWLCPAWWSARQMLRLCVLGTLTYIVVGAIVPTAVLMVHLATGCEGDACEDSLKVGKYAIMLASMIAINSLFELAHVFLGELKELNPIPKFVSVKLVIFFTFWQGIVLSWLVRVGAFDRFLDVGHGWSSVEKISQAVQHSLICLEMFAASITHHYAFPPEDYRIVWKMQQARTKTLLEVEEPDESAWGKHLNVVDPRDIFHTARFGFAPPHVREVETRPQCGSITEGSSEDGDTVE